VVLVVLVVLLALAVAVDGSDNIIVAGQRRLSNKDNGLIAKYNSSGTLQWDRTLGGTGVDSFTGVAVDSADNIICVGFTNSDGAGNYDGLIAKYNSSGTLQWDRTLGGSTADRFYAIAVDSSDNYICAGETSSDGAGSADGLIAKYNSSGTLQWDRTLGGTSSDQFWGIAVDSSDNYICAGYGYLTTSWKGIIAKYNSSGTLQWDRTLGGSGTDRFYGVAVDSSDNYICVGQTNSDGAGSYDGLIAKYNSSGTLQWDRTLGGTSSDQFWGIAVDSSDNYICAGETYSDGAGSADAMTFRIISDGTLTGTHGAFVYEDAVLTDAAAGLTDAAAVLTDAAAVLTDATETGSKQTDYHYCS
jgi:uncharacterized delta-60 repeat protein